MHLNLSFTISPDRRTLTIHANRLAREALRDMQDELGNDFGSDDSLYNALEHLICNSELLLISPEVCGDLTDAPILGITSKAEPRDESRNGDGAILAGRWADEKGVARIWVEPVIERWGYLPYCLRSPLSDLIDKGEAVFTAP